jgi:thiosulfate/3-mercaptopyruvate sulfurtransferase
MKIVKFCAFLLFSMTALFAQVSTQELLLKIDNPEIAILDTRSEDSYNGWILHNEARGGHIKNALPFPASWTKSMKKDDAVLQKLHSKKQIILYGASEKDTTTVYDFLKKQGLSDIEIYQDGIFTYAQNKDYPLERYANYEKLVPASYIKNLLDENKDIKVFEVSWGEGKEYKKSHIPTAVHINTDLVEEGPIWNYRSKEELQKFVLEYGISKNSSVILYGPDSMPASRVAVILMAMGVEDVRLLNGGYNAWLDAEYATQIKENKPQAISSFGGEFFTNENLIANIEDAEKILQDKNAQLVSIRSHAEFIGATSGYSYIKPQGRIKGAIWGKAGSDAYHLEDYRSITGKMKSKSEIYAMWDALGVDPSKHLSFYCGTGWRATEVLFYAYVMGDTNVSLYDGGWLEWSLDGKRPIINESAK